MHRETWVSARTAAKLLGITKPTLHRFRTMGLLPCYLFGARNYRFRVGTLEDFAGGPLSFLEEKPSPMPGPRIIRDWSTFSKSELEEFAGGPIVMPGSLDEPHEYNHILVRPFIAANLLGVSTKTLRYWRKTGNGPKFRCLGHSLIRYSTAELEEFAKRPIRKMFFRT